MQDCWARVRTQDVDAASDSYQTTQSQSKSVPAVIRNSSLIIQDFNPKTFVKTITYLSYGAYVILYCITLPLLFCLVASESSSVSTTCLGCIGVIGVYAVTAGRSFLL